MKSCHSFGEIWQTHAVTFKTISRKCEDKQTNRFRGLHGGALICYCKSLRRKESVRERSARTWGSRKDKCLASMSSLHVIQRSDSNHGLRGLKSCPKSSDLFEKLLGFVSVLILVSLLLIRPWNLKLWNSIRLEEIIRSWFRQKSVFFSFEWIFDNFCGRILVINPLCIH